MNPLKIFKSFADNNILDVEISHSKISSLYIECFRGEINNYSYDKSEYYGLSAIINSKHVFYSADTINTNNINDIIKSMVQTSKFVSTEDSETFKEKVKYKKYNRFNKDLSKVPTKIKKDLVLQIEKRLKDFDKRFFEVSVSYSEGEFEYWFNTSFGLNSHRHNNSYNISAFVMIKDNEEIKNEGLSFSSNDFTKFNIDDFVNELGNKLIKKLHPIVLPSKKYNVVFAPENTCIFLRLFVRHLNAELVLKNISYFKDKLNTLVASPKVTIFEKPLMKGPRFSAHDSQGVPSKNMDLIKKGILLTYLHNLKTAKQFNTVSNGHAVASGIKMSVAPKSALYLKEGKLSLDDLFKKIKNGIYITALEGLHAGINFQSGDFSLKAEGFVIKNGKLQEPLDMMTVNSNLFSIFKELSYISKNIEYKKENNFAPAILVKNIAISF